MTLLLGGTSRVLALRSSRRASTSHRGPGAYYAVPPSDFSVRNDAGLPGSWRTLAGMPCSIGPRRSRSTMVVGAAGIAYRPKEGVSLLVAYLSGLYRTARRTRCLRFAARVTP